MKLQLLTAIERNPSEPRKGRCRAAQWVTARSLRAMASALETVSDSDEFDVDVASVLRATADRMDYAGERWTVAITAVERNAPPCYVTEDVYAEARALIDPEADMTRRISVAHERVERWRQAQVRPNTATVLFRATVQQRRGLRIGQSIAE